ncbi:MAG: hypothetical protein JOZ69_12805 [Myxococcales bacterium]|nr:hypothetical protein [Myxococcales bacterium]
MRAARAIGTVAAVAMMSGAAWIGCSSNGNNSNSSNNDGGGPNGGAANAVTWTQVWTDVIDPHCADCHGRMPAADGGLRGGIRVGKLDLSSIDAGYASLVNTAAQGTSVPAVDYQDAAVCNTLQAGSPGSVRVVPGNAGASLLYLKVHGFDAPAPCGAPMPEPRPGPGEIDAGPLTQAASAAEIMTWIDQGAKP